MADDLVWVPIAGSLLIAGWALIQCARDRRFHDPLFYAVALLEAVILGQLAVGLVALAETARDVDAVTFVAYLVTAAVLPPVAVLWAASDHSRWGTAVVAGMALVEAVLSLRLLDIWTGPVG
jgi:RsiW-degrading membrane proteinase PrsW (M82 family)